MIHRITIIVCPLLVVAMTIAVWLHSLSLRQIPTALERPDHRPAVPPTPRSAPTQLASAVKKSQPAPAPTSEPSDPQREFYSSMLKQIESLQHQNQDLLDQLAETNRELMKLEFRVDTHSSQFRPLPVTEDRQDTGFEEPPSFDDSEGLLPPRPLVIGEDMGE